MGVLNTYLVTISTLAVEFEVFAHFCSKLVDIGSGWRELGILLAEGQAHEVLEGILFAVVSLHVLLNLGSISLQLG